MTNVSDLSVVDIEFLQAARDINKNPENYEKTGNSAYPANTASIKRATDLTDEQVSYRMGGNSNSKGFEKGDRCLIISHDPQVQGSTLGPRSVELTSYGLNTLNKAEKRMSRFAGVSKQDLERLETKVKINKERQEIMNHIKEQFKDISQRQKLYIDDGDNGETIIIFYDNIAEKQVSLFREYDSGDMIIYIRDVTPGEKRILKDKKIKKSDNRIRRVAPGICDTIADELDEYK